MIRATRPMAMTAVLALAFSACGGATTSPTPAPTPPPSGPTAQPTVDQTPVTIKVWDYYGEATPIQPALAGFQAEYPWITVDYQALDWDSMNEKFTIGVTADDAPDVATLDMTWLPTLAANDVLEDLSAMSGGQLNGEPITDQYTPGGVDAMTFDGHYIAMLFDFDAYSLYYRSDLFEAKDIAVPTSWDEMRAAMTALAEDSDGDGELDKYLYAIRPNVFHFSQFLFQQGGTLLNADNTQATFGDAKGLAALDYMKGFLDDGTGLYWSDDQGDLTPAIASEQVAVFEDGPYYMGLLKSGNPDQSGKWKIATAPFKDQPGSYLGGTGLGIPARAQHKDAAWKFIEYMLRPENEVGVFTYAGAAPATNAALESAELTKPDPYFGGDAPFSVFLDAMSSAHHFPYIGEWNDIDQALADQFASALLGQTTTQQALDAATAEVNDLLAP